MFSRSSPSRRAALLGAASLGLPLASKPTSATAAAPLPHTSAGLDIRKVSLQWLAAVKHEMSIEVPKRDPGFPAYRAAQNASAVLQDRLDQLAAQHAAPRDWSDLVALAEAARHWNDGFKGPIPQLSASRDTATLVHLANAVLLLAGRIPSMPAMPFADIEVYGDD